MGKPLDKSTPAEELVLPHRSTFPPNRKWKNNRRWSLANNRKKSTWQGSRPKQYFQRAKERSKLFTVKLWTALYNKCLEITNISTIWRESTVKVVYKGKESQNTPDSYRGIALECTPFKIFNILLGKIHDRVMTVIPREQHGFIPGRSTTQAVGHVLEYISEALSKCNIHRLQTSFQWGKQEQSTKETAPCSRCRKPDLQVHSLHHGQNSWWTHTFSRNPADDWRTARRSYCLVMKYGY